MVILIAIGWGLLFVGYGTYGLAVRLRQFSAES